ncbi:hypothetical protein KGF54_001883 [Candida jiufengensis]|uniref:uncharacterized protein n=1 Tax=Candida jiufengensis TaxID=497108 RepID=UPI0022243A6B|nr:uncharacterized protein KGF54_001883 [Candida jiufengensis]KAI5955322.1 hypothetical protein KGF54_001883 [Candida jiufengensis]
MLFKKKSKNFNESAPTTQTMKKSRSARNLINKLTNNNSTSPSSTTLKISTPITPPISNHWPSPIPTSSSTNNNLINLTPIINYPTRQKESNETEKLQTTTPLHQLTLLEQNPQYKLSPSTVAEFENESLIEVYSPRKEININEQKRLESACAQLDAVNLIEEVDVTIEKVEPRNISSEELNKEKFLSGNFSTSTSQQNSPNKESDNSKFSLTETNIQIYKRSHNKKNNNIASSKSSLHLINNKQFESPTKTQKSSHLSTSSSIKAGLIDTNKDYDQISKLYELEILLLKEKHHYEIKQLRREIKQLKKNQKSTTATDKILLPPFNPNLHNKEDEGNDSESLNSVDDSIMSLYHDRKISESSTIASATPNTK